MDWSSVWNILAGVGVVLLATALTVATAELGAAVLGASATVVGGAMTGALSGSIGLLSPQNAIGTHLLTNRGMQVGANSAISIMGYLLQSSVNGNTISLDGLLFAGLGGVLSGVFYNDLLRSLATTASMEILSYIM